MCALARKFLPKGYRKWRMAIVKIDESKKKMYAFILGLSWHRQTSAITGAIKKYTLKNCCGMLKWF